MITRRFRPSRLAPCPALGLAVVILAAGCTSNRERMPPLGVPAAGGPGLEIRFFTPPAEGSQDYQPTGKIDSWTRVVWAPLPHTPPEKTIGVRQGDHTVHTLYPGRYEFEYLVPHRQEQPLYGEMRVYGPNSFWAQDFLRHTFLLVSPGAGMSQTGHPSVLTEDDLQRALAGDVVAKVVFVADLKAIDGRIAMIDQELRRLRDEEGRLANQEEYWGVKTADRRRNALYFGDYGEDIPGLHLAFYQLLVGPEVYHWKRYSEAEDRQRTYQEKIASLRLPAERLREERSALRALQGSIRILHRRGDLVLATPSMTRRYHDPVNEVTEFRRTLHGPEPGIEAPYWFTEVAHTLHWPHPFSVVGIYPRLIETNNRMDTYHEPIGEVLMVMRVGVREPQSLK